MVENLTRGEWIRNAIHVDFSDDTITDFITEALTQCALELSCDPASLVAASRLLAQWIQADNPLMAAVLLEDDPVLSGASRGYFIGFILGKMKAKYEQEVSLMEKICKGTPSAGSAEEGG
jgi:hypothetical protein